jgi:repressor LexA
MRTSGERMREKIIDAINELSAEYNRPPTNRELGLYLGGKSTGHIDYHLRILKERGDILHDAKKSRGIALANAPERSEGLRVPIMGTIAAGSPISALEDTDSSFVTIPAKGPLPRSDSLFALRVKGTSMIDEMIDDGDIVVCQKQQTAADGDTVVALLEGPTQEGEATLKKFYREHDRVRLEPRNPTMEPIFVELDSIRIQGKVVQVIRQL